MNPIGCRWAVKICQNNKKTVTITEGQKQNVNVRDKNPLSATEVSMIKMERKTQNK